MEKKDLMCWAFFFVVKQGNGVPRNFVREVQQMQLRTDRIYSEVLEAAVISYQKFHFVK